MGGSSGGQWHRTADQEQPPQSTQMNSYNVQKSKEECQRQAWMKKALKNEQKKRSIQECGQGQDSWQECRDDVLT